MSRTSKSITRSASKIFTKYYGAYNIHPGSPDFPGRDPHHWACYSEAKRFGATIHEISKKVDCGKIIDTKLDKVNNTTSSKIYSKISNKNVYYLLKKFIPNFLNNDNIRYKNISWANKVNKRIDLIKMCNFNHIDDNEKRRRINAFEGFEKYFIKSN